MSSSKKPALGGISTRFARFVSRVGAGLPWYDVHLPLVPVRNDRLARTSYRPTKDLHESRLRADAESIIPDTTMFSDGTRFCGVS